MCGRCEPHVVHNTKNTTTKTRRPSTKHQQKNFLSFSVREIMIHENVGRIFLCRNDISHRIRILLLRENEIFRRIRIFFCRNDISRPNQEVFGTEKKNRPHCSQPYDSQNMNRNTVFEGRRASEDEKWSMGGSFFEACWRDSLTRSNKKHTTAAGAFQTKRFFRNPNQLTLINGSRRIVRIHLPTHRRHNDKFNRIGH